MSLLTIPTDVLLLILRLLDVKAILDVYKTCQRLRSLTLANKVRLLAPFNSTKRNTTPVVTTMYLVVDNKVKKMLIYTCPLCGQGSPRLTGLCGRTRCGDCDKIFCLIDLRSSPCGLAEPLKGPTQAFPISRKKRLVRCNECSKYTFDKQTNMFTPKN